MTCPFIESISIQRCVQMVKSGNYDSAFTASKVQDFLWENGKPLNFDPECIARTQDLPAIFKESVGCYVFTRDIYNKTRRRIGLKPYICEIGKLEGIDIDYPEDFDIANIIYMNMLKGRKENHF